MVVRDPVGIARLPRIARRVRVRRALLGGGVVVLVPVLGVNAVVTYVQIGSVPALALGAWSCGSRPRPSLAFATLAAARFVAAPIVAPVADRYDVAAA